MSVKRSEQRQSGGNGQDAPANGGNGRRRGGRNAVRRRRGGSIRNTRDDRTVREERRRSGIWVLNKLRLDLCAGKLNGGGHMLAAGFNMQGCRLPQDRAKILGIVIAHYREYSAK